MLGSLNIGMNASCVYLLVPDYGPDISTPEHLVTYLNESSPDRPGVEVKEFPKFHRFDRYPIELGMECDSG